MRVVEYWTLPQPSGVLTGLDGFAELAGALSMDPAIGGFRIVRPRHSHHGRIRARALRRRASARLQASGSLSVLFICGLALSVLAGPSSCPCEPGHSDAMPLAAVGDAQTLSRFAYSRASEIGLARPAPAGSEVTPLTKLASLVDAYAPAYAAAASPISTAAITPATQTREIFVRPAHLGALPTKIEKLAAAQPEPIRLAAVTPATDVPVPLLPVIEIIAPDDMPEATTTADEADASRTRAISKRRHHARRARKARSSDPAVNAAQKYARAPRWAKQMFDNPWQSSAFSYIR